MLPAFQIQSNRTKSSFGLSKSQNLSESKQKLLPYQRREQLKNLLIVKFMKKYGFRKPEDFLEEEVSKFVISEKLSEKDLRRLDQRIRTVYEERKIQKSLQYSLTTKNKSGYQSDFKSPSNNMDNISTISRKSLSIAPSLSKNNSRPQSAAISHSVKNGPKLVLQTKKPEPFEKKIGDNCYFKETFVAPCNSGNSGFNPGGYENNMTDPNQMDDGREYNNNDLENANPDECPQEENKEDLNNPNLPPGSVDENELNRFEFSGGDEWHAIVEYNHKKYEEDLKQNRLKDLEVKRRQKEDLDLQIREKLVKKEHERIINREYDNLLDKHLIDLKENEVRRDQQVKAKDITLKNSRDQLLKNEKLRKKEIMQREKVFEKEHLKKIKEEIEKNNQAIIKRKQLEKDALQVLLSENEYNKQRAKEIFEQERNDDIRITKEYTQIIDRQDQERNNFFKNKLRLPNEASAQLVENVLKSMEIKRKYDDERIQNYEKEKERKEKIQDEVKRRTKEKEKVEIRHFLDMQVEEKNKSKKYEQEINTCQAHIWSEDTKKFYEQERELSEKIKSINRNNFSFLKNQIENKNGVRKVGMTDSEFLLNKHLLKTIVTTKGK